jgi:hypothetical protein
MTKTKNSYIPPKGHSAMNPAETQMNLLRQQLQQEFQALGNELNEVRSTLAGLLVIAERAEEGDRFMEIREKDLGPRIQEFQKAIGNIWWNVPEEKFYKIPTYASEFELIPAEDKENTWLGVNKIENIEWTITADNQQEAYNIMMEKLNELIMEERKRMENAEAVDAEAEKAVLKVVPAEAGEA